MGDETVHDGFWTEIDPEESRIVALTDALRAEDGPADLAGGWPEALWSRLVDAGATRWSVAREQGGDACPRPLAVQRYARLAEASLTAVFLLSQHDAAVRRLATVAERSKAAEWLSAIARGEVMATVGISQLTTSRRLGAKALVATEIGPDRYRLDGSMPWVTGAERADVFVTGALLEDGRQLLVGLPSDRPGLTVLPAFELAALQASRTAEVVVKGVEIAADDVLMGPTREISAQTGAVGTAGLETSALALGQAAAAIGGMASLTADRVDLIEPVELLRENWGQAWSTLMRCARGEGDAATAAALRAQANALALKSTQAFLTARRGSGFLRTDPAQRWARQALFFLVWSCPSPIAQAAIRDLAGLCPA
ncbi:acyl-CoA dehydrogenase family protein [Planctomyces sp. SH-PL62]|uniref:acyl-CoA dehydrogenase family protein n=1 Tax=Planctomyces sp. SH-PL62 TaxID=1636152 RepID=UPI00078DAE88|nr:acyl-CoA dehydrogenase family protein [Planctomyces sp. SH-PL62]AMV36990.1 Acryloyl-CoA reductase (NADH) [Planctomyces sp. SH-PL62]